MDSSNSGSFQSSSGAAMGAADTEEFDSRTPTISSFFNPSNNFNSNLLPPPPTDTTFFNHPSPYPPNPVQHHPGSPWTGTYLINPNPLPIDTNTKTTYGSNHHHNQIGVSIKNPKKRTRASRRAPTTVLTTDTTNFRQMVQEFTGIPTLPFSTTRRLDLFRPTAQKLQQPPPYLINNPMASTNILESGTSFLKQQPSTNLLDLQNPMLSFQSLLQTSLTQAASNGLQSSSKMEGFNNIHKVVSSTSGGGGDQVQGNEGSWIFPSS